MYSILLVDDEDEVRRSIRECTPWEEYGFSVIGEASNGREALDFLDDTMPDVIITDIRMPYLDGIGFIEEVRKNRSESVEVIILSGYDEFTFAQTAMRLNVAEYVLKPVSISSMKDVLRRAKARLDDDKAKASEIMKLESVYQDAMEIYRERYLISLMVPPPFQRKADSPSDEGISSLTRASNNADTRPSAPSSESKSVCSTSLPDMLRRARRAPATCSGEAAAPLEKTVSKVSRSFCFVAVSSDGTADVSATEVRPNSSASYAAYSS